MIDQARLSRISLHPRPLGQRVVGCLFLGPNYNFPGRKTHIVLEGQEHIPRGPGGQGAIFVMNHTDRYNYWPFQYQLWRDGLGYTATWVKGKYYENAALGWFMDSCNNIPVPSRGYVLTKDFQRAMGRKPGDDEYAALKRLADGHPDDPEGEATAIAAGGEGVRAFLSRPFPDAPSGRYAESLELRFNDMMRRVVEISQDGLAKGLHLLIFPQGTRSIHLTRGHLGAAQLILHTGATVVPVGCNGSDRCYPADSPWSRGGTVTYRIGAPLTSAGELAPFRVPLPFAPFTRDADRFAPTFRALTDLLMDRINGLLDPPYKYAASDEPARGASRFV